jgi:hypothetical protein
VWVENLIAMRITSLEARGNSSGTFASAGIYKQALKFGAQLAALTKRQYKFASSKLMGGEILNENALVKAKAPFPSAGRNSAGGRVILPKQRPPQQHAHLLQTPSPFRDY